MEPTFSTRPIPTVVIDGNVYDLSMIYRELIQLHDADNRNYDFYSGNIGVDLAKCEILHGQGGGVFVRGPKFAEFYAQVWSLIEGGKLK